MSLLLFAEDDVDNPDERIWSFVLAELVIVIGGDVVVVVVCAPPFPALTEMCANATLADSMFSRSVVVVVVVVVVDPPIVALLVRLIQLF